MPLSLLVVVGRCQEAGDSVVLFGSVITVEWPFLVMAPAAASSLVAVLSWLVIYFEIWRLSLDVPQLRRCLLRPGRRGWLTEMFLLLAGLRRSRIGTGDVLVRVYRVLWCNVIIAIAFVLPLMGAAVVMFARRMLLDGGCFAEASFVVLPLAHGLFALVAWVVHGLCVRAGRWLRIFGDGRSLGRSLLLFTLLYLFLAFLVSLDVTG